MDYIAFTARNIIILLSAMIIYAGCRRSYSIYFFERDAKKIVFLENESAVVVPLILSVLLIILYHSLKLSGDDMEEKLIEEKSSQIRTSNISRQLARKLSVKLGSISESAIENYEEMRTKSNKDLLEKVKNEDDSSSEEYLVSGETVSDSSLKDVLEQLAKESEEVGENVDDAVISDGRRFFRRISLRRKSILSDHELAIERKQSEIYKKISQISFLPSVSEVVTLRHLSINISKKSILNTLARLVTIHVPVWIGVIAIYITIIEVFDNHIFYYHHPRMKLLSIIIAMLLGLFHEVKWTWVINDVLGIVTSYVIIARTETASYFAGFLFLVGMIFFDIFWSYCINLLTLVTTYSRSSIMLIIPLGKEKSAKLSVIDIVAPGIFLNIVLKFAEMYDTGTFLLSFYAVLFGLFITELIGLLRQKTTPAIVIPGIFAILASMLSVENPSDLWRFGIKH